MKRMLLFAVAWVVVILGLCSIPGHELPNIDIVGADKIAHLGMFAVLASLWLNALETDRLWPVILIVGGLFGLGLEYYQGWCIPGRTADLADAVANAIGLALGLTATLLWRARLVSSPT